jgi:hypothetical protein
LLGLVTATSRPAAFTITVLSAIISHHTLPTDLLSRRLLVDAPTEVVAAARARVANQGW